MGNPRQANGHTKPATSGTTEVDSQRQPISDLSIRVAAAARLAWESNGESVEVKVTPVNGHARMAYVVANGARHTEFVVEEDDADVWSFLQDEEPHESWRLRALVRLPLLGVAHEKLRTHGYELQGWWAREGCIQFGGIETA